MRNRRSIIVAAAILGIAVAAYFFLRAPSAPVDEITTTASELIPPPEEVVAEKAPVPQEEAVAPVEVPPSVYTLIARVWTREGHLVPGAELNCIPAATPDAPDAAETDTIVFHADEEGKAVQDFAAPGPFVLSCEHEDYRANYPVNFAVDNICYVDLVLRPKGEIRGQTVDSSGKPVVDATIIGSSRWGGERARATSDGDGRFTFSDLAPDLIVLKAEHENYATTLSEPTQTGSEVRLVMTQGGSLLINARDSEGGGPVGDLSVELAGIQRTQAKVQGTTARNGELKLEGLSPGGYDLKSNDGTRVLIPVQKRVEIAANALARVEVQVEAAASIRGQVVDRDTRAGIAGVSLYHRQVDPPVASTSSATTDREGNFVLAGLAGGTHDIAPSKWPPIYGRGGRLGLMQSVQVQSGEQRTGLIVELVAGPRLRGKVVYENGDPAPGAKVTSWLFTASTQQSLRLDAGETVADREGNFVFARVPQEADLMGVGNKESQAALQAIAQDPRDIYLRASLRMLASPEHGPVTVGNDDVDGIVLTLETVELASIAGRVIRQDGGPVSDFTVTPSPVESVPGAPSYPSPQTDADGYFLMTDIHPGTYSFTLSSADGGSVFPIDEQITVAEGQVVTDLHLALATSGFSLSGVVHDEYGQVVRDYPIVVERYEDSDDEFEPFYGGARTDAKGQFLIENVHEGLYRIRNDDSGAQWSMTVETGTEIVVKLPPAVAGVE